MSQRVTIVIEIDGMVSSEGIDGGIESVENLYDRHALADSAEEMVVIVRGTDGATEEHRIPLSKRQ